MVNGMDYPIIYIILNGELNMSPGKAAAQAAHAMASLDKVNGIKDFSSKVQRAVIVLEAENQQQIGNLEDYLFDLEIPAEKYIDEGVNEVSAYSVTGMAVGPIWASDEAKREILRPFPLFGKDKSEKRKQRWWKR